MTEYETDPQRSPAAADAEPTAELPPAQRGQSDTAPDTPAAAPAPADSPAAGALAAPDTTPTAPDAGRADAPAPGTHPAGPYAPQTVTPSAPPYPGSGQPQPGGQHPGAPWYAGPQQTGWTAGAHQGGTAYQPHPGGAVPPYQGTSRTTPASRSRRGPRRRPRALAGRPSSSARAPWCWR